MISGPAEVQTPRVDEDDLVLPPRDVCAHYLCGRPRAEHIGFANGGPHHSFEAPEPVPLPARVASASIETQWACTHCGALCMVEGVANFEWMECDRCGRQSYLVF